MARLHGVFDPSAVDYGADRSSPLPEGGYTARIIESSEGATKTGSGRMIELTWEVVDGPHQGRRVWQHVNYINMNPTAQQIGQIMLGKIALACGHSEAIGSTDVLHDRPCEIRLSVKRQDGYGDRNDVRDVQPVGPDALPPAEPEDHHGTDWRAGQPRRSHPPPPSDPRDDIPF